MKERAHARSLYITEDCSPARKLCGENSSMVCSERGGVGTVTAFLHAFRTVGSGGFSASLVAVFAVVRALGLEVGRKGQRMQCLGVLTELL
jgi:hypothetical protein